MTEPGRPRSAARIVTVDAGQDGQRIDNFLVRILKGVPKSYLYRILRKGEVRVNKGRIRPDYRLRAGDQVRIPPLRSAQRPPGAQIPETAAQRVRQALLYEDDDLMVLDKPAGIAVHGGSGLGFGVIEILRQLRPQAQYLELVHRLDRDTSGCLLIAKCRAALLELQAQLSDGMTKGYLALMEGQWRGGKRAVSAPLRKNTLQGGERMVRVSDDGKQAVSHFAPVEVFRDASLMEVYLDTGRTHQIRVHAAHCGHPLAGDGKYGSAAFNRRMRELGLKRLFLHAHRLSFRRPGRVDALDISAPLPADLQNLLDKLER
jgi:23S rRNA pseudouridine955/2504/2580 synthase